MNDDLRECFDEAQKIAALIEREGFDVIVIGAMALAAHRYIRFTEDVDLAIVATIAQTKKLVTSLKKHQYRVKYRAPDAQDPLGGVIDIFCKQGIVQIVNFGERFPAVIEDALITIRENEREKPGLRVTPLPHLIVLKMYAGGWKSMSDIVEVLKRNPEADLEEIGKLCRKYRIRGWNQILKAL